jgi:hypothetical protein
MPNRVIRDGILDSRTVNSLTDSGEIFYRRLMSVVDDYGRFEADPELLRARCFPRSLDRWTLSRVSDALSDVSHVTDMDGKPLVLVYQVGTKKYLEIQRFDQRLRIKKARHPAPSDGQMTDTCPSHDSQMTDTRRPVVESESESESESEEKHTHTSRVRSPLAADLDGQTSERFPELLKRYPLKTGRDEACREYLSVVSVEKESDQVARGIVMGLAKWIRQNHRDGWTARWPARVATQRVVSKSEAVKELALGNLARTGRIL